MKKVFEFSPTDTETMVARTLMLVHQAIDDAFPDARPAPNRFAKTIFGEEPTVNQLLPHEHQAHRFSEDSLREVSERLSQQPKPILMSDESPLIADDGRSLSLDEEMMAPLFDSKQKRLKQTLIGSLILIIGLIFGYLFW